MPGKPEGRKTARTVNRVEFNILAKKIRKLRQKAKIGGAELSERLGKPRGYIYKVETGRQYPDFATILDILRILSEDPLAVVGEIIAESEPKG